MNDRRLEQAIVHLRHRKAKLEEMLRLRDEVRDLEGRSVFDGGGLGKVSAIVIGCVSRHFNLSVAEIVGNRRLENLVIARHIAWDVIRTLAPKASIISIARVFKRDHGTLLHGLQRIKDRCEVEPGIRSARGLIESDCRLLVAKHFVDESPNHEN